MNKIKQGGLHIGISGVLVPGNKTSFPPQFQSRSRLYYYSSFFNTLEINSSFYKIPMARTFVRWASDVTPGFKFTIKLWKEITHIKDLRYEPGNIQRFLDAAQLLGDAKACLLVQFPGKISFDYYNEVEEILMSIRENNVANDWRIAVEFRNAGWYVMETNELLDECGASLVLHDIRKSRNTEPNRGAGFVYLRFHGPAGDYRGSYTDEHLQDQAARIKGWRAEGKDVFAYFNNTIGSAYENAIALKIMCGEE